jgi:hypothetical protein
MPSWEGLVVRLINGFSHRDIKNIDILSDLLVQDTTTTPKTTSRNLEALDKAYDILATSMGPLEVLVTPHLKDIIKRALRKMAMENDRIDLSRGEVLYKIGGTGNHQDKDFKQALRSLSEKVLPCKAPKSNQEKIAAYHKM